LPKILTRIINSLKRFFLPFLLKILTAVLVIFISYAVGLPVDALNIVAANTVCSCFFCFKVIIFLYLSKDVEKLNLVSFIFRKMILNCYTAVRYCKSKLTFVRKLITEFLGTFFLVLTVGMVVTGGKGDFHLLLLVQF
jgi:hypothetical protein